MEITGAVAGILLAGGSIGGMTGSALTGFLFDHYTHMWVVYLCLIACSAHVAVYVVSTIIVKCVREERGLRQRDMMEMDTDTKNGR